MQNKLFLLFMGLHVGIYRATKGKIGGKMGAMDILLLTTIGRKTGIERTKPLAYFKDGKKYVVVASAAGAPKHPSWYFNLEANPKVEVQIGGRIFEANAKTAPKKKRNELWKRIVQAAPNFDEYTKKADRIIPVVLLTPRS